MATGLTLAVYGLLLVAAAVLVWRRPVAALYAWVVGLAAHNAVMAALYGAGVRGGALTALQAWKEILLAVALARVCLEALRARRLAFQIRAVDLLALAFAVVVCVYAVLPQSWLDGTADRSAIGLALKHDLIPVGAYFLGRSLLLRREQLVPLAWTLLGVAGVVAFVGLLDVFFVPISWWRDSAVVDYFHKQLGYDYHGTGGLPENFIYNTGSDVHFLRRLVSVFLGPLASAYCFVAALIVAAALRRRLRLLIPLSALIFVGLLFTFSRSSLLALAAGLVVLAYLLRAWWPLAAALRRRLRLLIPLAALIFVGLLFTFSRSSLLALAAGLVVLAYLLRAWWPLAAAVATLAVSVAWVHAFPHVAPEGKWTKQDLVLQHNIAKQHPGATGNAGSINEPSIHSHWISLREGVRTVFRHPQGYGLGNAGQTASRTGTEIRAGESNYTEIGAETGLLGAVIWLAWNLSIFVGLVRRCAAAIAAVFAAIGVLAIQTDVIGDPWVGYSIWALAGIGLSEVALTLNGDRSARRYRPRPPEGERPRARDRVLP